jgi:hypothetical protein
VWQSRTNTSQLAEFGIVAGQRRRGFAELSARLDDAALPPVLAMTLSARRGLATIGKERRQRRHQDLDRHTPRRHLAS